jgi:hypothetical protein
MSSAIAKSKPDKSGLPAKFNYIGIKKEETQKLKLYAEEVRGLIRNTLEAAVRIGQILKDVKENILQYGQWQKWVDYEFEGNIKHDTATNFINLANLYEKYKEEHEDGFKKLTLWSLYSLGRESVEPEVKEAVLNLANDDIILSKQEIDSVVKTYRQIKMLEAGIEGEVVQTLKELDTVEDPREVKSLSKLSKRKQKEVAELISTGGAESTKEALKKIVDAKRKNKEEEAAIDIETVEINEQDGEKIEVDLVVQEYHYKNLKDVPDNSIDVAFVEAPLRYSYVEFELHELAKELDRVLCSGGYAIITVGHKAAMFSGPCIEPLNAAHLLCFRKTPGMSKSIVGMNITSASVFAIFCYKGPYKAPRKMLVDLQTYSSHLTDTDAIEGMDEIPPSLEKGIERFLSPLTEAGSCVMHVIVDNHFGVRESIKEMAGRFSARKFITVG